MYIKKKETLKQILVVYLPYIFGTWKLSIKSNSLNHMT